jgi:2-oxoacid:acceptor oxidoreductase gamma subunit (pyruvate/2-ketoisovalerate family)
MAGGDREEKVYSVTWHGRGGQGAVTAAMILAEAAYLDGYKGVTAAPFFGVERRGAPVTASTRFCRQRLRTVSQVGGADVILVLDERLLKTVDVLAGLSPGGLLVVNSRGIPEGLCNRQDIVVATSDAAGIAKEIGLVVAGTVVINTPLLGAFARASGLVTMSSLEQAIRQNFKEKAAELNIRGARLTFETTRTTGTWRP